MLEFNATFIVALISFIVFIIIMNAIFYCPILNIVKKRDDYLNSNYLEAEKKETETDYQKNNYANSLTKMQQKCMQDFIEAKKNAYDTALQEINTARINAKKQIDDEKFALHSQESQLKKDLELNSVDDIALSIQSKVIGN